MPPTPNARAGPVPPVPWSSAAAIAASAGSPDLVVVGGWVVVAGSEASVVVPLAVPVELVVPCLPVDRGDEGEGVDDVDAPEPLPESSLCTPAPNRPPDESPPEDPLVAPAPELVAFLDFAFACRRAFCTGMSYSRPDGELGSMWTPSSFVLCADAPATGTTATTRAGRRMRRNRRIECEGSESYGVGPGLVALRGSRASTLSPASSGFNADARR